MYNIFIILGLTCLVPAAGIPVSPELVRVDIPVMVAVVLLCAPVFYSNSRVSRLEGRLFVATYIGYQCTCWPREPAAEAAVRASTKVLVPAPAKAPTIGPRKPSRMSG